MFEQIAGILHVDWVVLQRATTTWLNGGNPYAALGGPHDPHPFAGAFAYPPFALTWLCLFTPLGKAGFWVWSALELCGWWLLVRRTRPGQIALLMWSPVIVHLLLGQSTLAVVLALWAAYEIPAEKRINWARGALLAFALTKPQTALLPLLWLLYNERRGEHRSTLWAGLLGTFALLCLPPTLRDPGIWTKWLAALSGYQSHQQFQTLWRGWGLVTLPVVLLLWSRQWRAEPDRQWQKNPWPWLLTIALFPQAAVYSSVTLLPAIRPRSGYAALGGLAVSSVLISPITALTQPLFFSGHLLAGWLMNGGFAARGRAG